MAFNTQVLANGPRNYIIKVDGAATEAASSLVDVSAIGCSEVHLEEITYDVLEGAVVELLWDATSDVSAFKSSGHEGNKCFSEYGGIPNNAGAGKTGDVLLTVTGTSPTYWFIAKFKKIP